MRLLSSIRLGRCRGAARAVPPVALDAGEIYNTLLLSPPFELRTAEYLTSEGVLVTPPTGAILTPSGWFALLLVALWSWFSPIGLRKYLKQQKEAEAGLWPADPENLTAEEEASREAAMEAEEAREVWRGRWQAVLPAGFVAYAAIRLAIEAGAAGPG